METRSSRLARFIFFFLETKREEKRSSGRGGGDRGRDANRVAMAVAVKVKFVNETSGTAGKPK